MRSTNAAVSFISAPLWISAAFACTDASVCLSLGRFSARPEAAFSQESLAPASCSRASRSSGCRRTTSAESTSAEGMRPDSLNARCTACTCGATGAQIATKYSTSRRSRSATLPLPSATRRICRSTRAHSCFTPKPRSSPFSTMPSSSAPTVHQNARRLPWAVMSSMPATASRIIGGTGILAAQPGEHAALIEAALLDHVRRQPVRRDRFARRDARRPGRQVGVEQVGRRGGLHAPRHLHRLVFGIELERDRRRAVDQFVQEDPQLPAGAIDDGARRLGFGRGQLLHPRQLPLQFVGEGDDGVQSHHLDRAGSLVHVRARMLQRGGIGRIRLERGDRLQPARQRLVDFPLHPGQRAYIKSRSGIVRHGRFSLVPGRSSDREQQESSQQEPGRRPSAINSYCTT